MKDLGSDLLELALRDFVLYKVFQGSNKVIDLLKTGLFEELNEVLGIDVLHFYDGGIGFLLKLEDLRHTDVLVFIFCSCTLLLGLEGKTLEIPGIGR